MTTFYAWLAAILNTLVMLLCFGLIIGGVASNDAYCLLALIPMIISVFGLGLALETVKRNRSPY